MCAKSLQSCPALCDSMDRSPPGSSVRGILQARILAAAATAKSLQSCLTLSDPMDCNIPGSSAHGIFQAKVLEWGAISSSRGSSWTRHWTHISCYLLHWQAGSLLLAPPVGNPYVWISLFCFLPVASPALPLPMVACSLGLLFGDPSQTSPSHVL